MQHLWKYSENLDMKIAGHLRYSLSPTCISIPHHDLVSHRVKELNKGTDTGDFL